MTDYRSTVVLVRTPEALHITGWANLKRTLLPPSLSSGKQISQRPTQRVRTGTARLSLALPCLSAMRMIQTRSYWSPLLSLNRIAIV